MKTHLPTRRRREGFAVLVVLALLTIILLYVSANLHSLHVLHSELRLVEKQQLQRLNAQAGITNNAVTADQPTSAKNAPR